jgi:hypothetical protein
MANAKYPVQFVAFSSDTGIFDALAEDTLVGVTDTYDASAPRAYNAVSTGSIRTCDSRHIQIG